MTSDDVASTVSYILESEDRLKIACAIRYAWDDLRKRVIAEFVAYLADLLRKDGWDDVKLDWPQDGALDKARSLIVRHAAWPPNCFLQIAGDTWGPNHVRLSFCGVPATDATFGKYQDSLGKLGWSWRPDPGLSRPWQIELWEIFGRQQWWYADWASPQAIQQMGRGSSRDSFASDLVGAFAKARVAVNEVRAEPTS